MRVLLSLLVVSAVLAVAVAQDPVTKVYWGDRATGTIWRANTDGSNREAIVTDNVGSPRQLALDDSDPAAPMVYWTDNANGRILAAAADGSQPSADVLADQASGITTPTYLRLHVDGADVKWLYFADSETTSLACTVDEPCSGLKRINLDTNELTTLTDATVFGDSLITGNPRLRLHGFEMYRNPLLPAQTIVWLLRCNVPQDCVITTTTLADLEVSPSNLGTNLIENLAPSATSHPSKDVESVLYFPRDLRYFEDGLWMFDRAHLFRVDLSGITPPVTRGSQQRGQWQDLATGVSPTVTQFDMASNRTMWTEAGDEKLVHAMWHDGSDHLSFHTGLASTPQGIATGDVNGSATLAVSAMLVCLAAFAALLMQ